LESKYLYLWINILSFIVPFLFSFYPKANFSKKWRYVIPAILVTAVVFIAWDAVFTRLGVWGFNPRYISGIYLLGLPLEEILFFLCIPYACLFTYFALSHLVEKDHLFPHQELISSALIILFLVFGSYHLDKLYTAVTFLFTGLFLALVMIKLRVRFMGRFYFAFALLLIPFFIVNGILTGAMTEEPVVWYNNAENIGVRIGTIPLEDAVYGLLMILMPITIWEKAEERVTRKLG
jgi:lycopene cyclase domain-containing protein